MGLIARYLAAIVFTVLTVVPGLAHACTCMLPEPPARLIGTDAIFDGYVLRIDRTEKYTAVATMRVLREWKGDLPSIVTLRYAVGTGQCDDGFSSLEVNTTFPWVFANGDTRNGKLFGGFCDIAYRGPGSEQERLVREYAARHQALREAADLGSTRDVLRFAEFLLAHNDEPQAYDRLTPILRDEPQAFRRWIVDEDGYDVLVRIRHQWDAGGLKPTTPPAAPNAEGRVARAIFALTSVADPTWNDWSNIEPIGGECDFDGATLVETTFAGSRLDHCSFTGGTLTDVNFSGTNLANAKFEHARLTNVNLSDANLYKAVFDGAIIDTALMIDLNGYGAVSFKGSTLRHARISGSLSGDFTGATLEDITVHADAIIDLSAATLRDAVIDGGRMTFVGKGAHLANVRFNGTRLRGVHAEGTDLSDVIFTNVPEMTLYADCQTKLPLSFPIDTRALIPVERDCPTFASRTDFRGVNWEYRDLRGLNFAGGDFTGAKLTGAKLAGTDFSGANLGGLDFNYTSLSGAVLDGAKLDGATNLVWFASTTDARSEDTYVPPASLRGTTFTGTTIMITRLVGVVGQSDSIDLLAPNLNNATLDCEDRPRLYDMPSYQVTEAKLAAQRRREAEAIRVILAHWPSVTLTGRCAALQGLATSATP